MPKLKVIAFVASLETRHYSFQTVSLTSEADARAQLIEGLVAHGQECSIAEDWWKQYDDAMRVDAFQAGAVHRDGIRIYKRPTRPGPQPGGADFSLTT